jgi:hypothetical protein
VTPDNRLKRAVSHVMLDIGLNFLVFFLLISYIRTFECPFPCSCLCVPMSMLNVNINKDMAMDMNMGRDMETDLINVYGHGHKRKLFISDIRLI